MDLIKIGRFIAERRKEAKLTQMQLAEMLNITDRAVSKWETGRALPDSSIMLSLCEILKITVNDLLNGEVVSMENYDKEAERKMLELVKQKEKSDKQLLRLELVMGFLFIAILLATCIIAAYAQMEDWLRFVIIGIGVLPLLVALPVLIAIEQKAGYYECQACGHRYVPTFASVFLAMHMARTRYMKCPKCQKRSWQKKVISKDE